TVTQNTAIVNPKSAIITTNFAPTVAYNCFASSWVGVTSTTKAVGSSYQTTITANDSTDWSGKVTPGYLNLSVGCGLSGGATVLSGVAYGVVSGVSIDGSTLNIAQPCSSTSCKDPGNGKIISGYYPNWARYGKNFPLSKVPFANMNEVLYAFIGFDPATGDVKSLDAWADQNEMPTLSKAVLQYPYMHATLSFGGWTNAGAFTAPMFAQLTSSDASIANFTKQSVAAMRAAGYDGIDIDWEWWSSYTTAPAAAQIKLYTSLRNALNTASQQDGKKYRLTIAVVAGVDKIQATETAVSGAWKTIAGLVDNINVMAYDMHGAFDKTSDFQAPWGMEANSPNLATKYDIQDAMNAYVGYGVPASKLVLGVPAYGRSMNVASLDNYGLYQTVTGVPGGDNDDASSGATGVFLYNCIINSAVCNHNGATIAALTFVNQESATFNQLSSQAQEPWAYGSTPQGNIFLTYDNVATATFKTQKVKANGYGGVMVWEIDGDAVDNPTMSLINAMKTELNK
ncbi:MAG: glycoside hydrolase family 18 protein, partial [Neisseriaceae bacterium]